MSRSDLFNAPSQSDLFAGEKRREDYRPDPNRVRQRLLKLIAEAKAAESMPWDAAQLGYLKLVVPQTSRWLPDEEAAQLRFQFEQEVKRLELLAA